MVRTVRETYEPMPGQDRALLPGAIEEERMASSSRRGYSLWRDGAGKRTRG